MVIEEKAQTVSCLIDRKEALSWRQFPGYREIDDLIYLLSIIGFWHPGSFSMSAWGFSVRLNGWRELFHWCWTDYMLC